MAEPTIKPETWCLVELMGHRTRAGRVSEVEIAGSKFLRVDIPTDDGQYVTEFYGGSSIYAITPGSEELIRYRYGDKPLPARPVAFKERPTLPPPDEGVTTEAAVQQEEDEFLSGHPAADEEDQSEDLPDEERQQGCMP